MNGYDKSFVYDALVEENYFPAQKREREEMPPMFSTNGLQLNVRKQLESIKLRRSGYDEIIFKATRFNNVPRYMSIPHPLPYIQLAHCITTNWDKLDYTAKNNESRIKPEKHSDGRLIIMDYETAIEQSARVSKTSFGKKFVVHTDISSCFPSVYSHSIPWALVGLSKAKSNRDRKEWFNKLDYHQRMLRRTETIGLPIGPATSNVIIEAILARIDQMLIQKGFTFHRDGAHSRFIDDYTAYCNSHADATRFLRLLGEELEKYRLLLNIKKTEILEQATPLTPLWLSELSTRLSGTDRFEQIDAIRYLDFALSLLSANPDGSVLKYIAKSLLSKSTVGKPLISYILNLSFYYPILLPLLKTRLHNLTPLQPFEEEMTKILSENARNKRSDAMSWAIFYMNALSFDIPKTVAEEVVKSEDCFAITALYASGNHTSLIIDFVKQSVLATKDLYLIDRYWLLLYQLFLDNYLINPYGDEDLYPNHKKGGPSKIQATIEEIRIFDILKDEGITFLV